MKSYCIRNSKGQIFKIAMNESELNKFLEHHPEFDKLKDCSEYDDANSIVIE